MSLYQYLADHFQTDTQNESASLCAVRQNAFEIFKQQNFPTVKNEEWRFTNIIPYVQQEYATELASEVTDVAVKEAISALTIPGLDGYKMVIVNGTYNASLSTLPEAADFVLESTKDKLGQAAFADTLNLELPLEKFPLVALNTAWFKTGYSIYLKKDFRMEKPIQIMHIYAGSQDSLIQPRHHIYIEQGANAEIIESFACLGQHQYLVNSVSEISLEKNAQCSHAVFQKNSKGQRFIKHIQVIQHRDSLYNNYTITMPEADLVRNNLNVILKGEHTETHMYGLYLVGNKQLVDNHSLVDHRYPNCESNQMYKGVMLEGGKGVFNGKIHVHRPAQKTNAFQQNNNLLFGDNATINTKPQLEIFADDVKCSHGSTVGQFDKESLYYLTTRGIGKEAARSMLVNAFAFDVTEKLDNEHLRNYINGLIKSTINAARAGN